MQDLLFKEGRLNLYLAGLPNFPRNFTRDSIIYAILLRDPKALSDQLKFNAMRQGKKNDPHSGEEPGKIFHEYPGVVIEGFSSEYNACDTTALYLLGHEFYIGLTGKKDLAHKQRPNIEAAAIYILKHIKDDLFFEDPSFCGAARFALNVTYWKDSQVTGRLLGKPVYPVVYTLAHVQNLRGLRSAAKLLDRPDLGDLAERMAQALDRLFDHDLGVFYIGLDKLGPIRGVSSDSLHLLFYLEKKDLAGKKVRAIEEASQVLETPIGYRTIDANSARGISDEYHSRTIWPFEQALIHSGARKFGLDRAVQVSSRIMEKLRADAKCDPETYQLVGKRIKMGGCHTQLWTIAAKKYFQQPELQKSL